MFSSPSAVAAPSLLDTAVCIGTQEVTYDPGLSNEPRNLTVSGHTTLGCVSTVPGTHSGEMSYSVPVFRACDTPVEDPEFGGSKTITWYDGRTTDFSWDADGIETFREEAQTVILIKGVVTSGVFLGRHVTQQIVEPNPDLAQCDTPEGVTRATAVETLTVGPL
jgi:hypothetical protein